MTFENEISLSKPSKALTARQEEVFHFIREQTQANRMPPTVREIGEHFRISSTNGVRSILAALAKKGYIKRSPRRSRGIEVLDFEDHKNPGSGVSVEIPIVGRIAAGMPILAVQNLEGTVTVDRDFIANQPNVFALHVRGDSMINAGIFDGDLIFARQQNSAERGEIIVAQVDDEATVKYFQPQSEWIELHAANPKYSPIIVKPERSFTISGRVIGVMRKIN